jgi:prepilin-type N-terminal cleavage/methylation domain-containing protein
LNRHIDSASRLLVDERGMTLIELLVAVLIIGILTSMAFLVYGNSASSARDKTCMANMRTIAAAVIQYQTMHQVYPPDGAAGVVALRDGDYLKNVPDDPHPGAGPYTINGTSGLVDCDPPAGTAGSVHEKAVNF